MSIEIDTNSSTCIFTHEGTRHEWPITEVRVSTDPEARMSIMEKGELRKHISENDAERLVAAGAEDGRFHLIVYNE